MNCDETKALLHAYVDGELDLVRSIEVEKHIQSCASCRAACGNATVLKKAIASNAPYFKAPGTLRDNILAQVRQSSAAEEPLHETTTARPRRGMGMLSAGLAMAACLALGFFIALETGRPSTREVLVGELTSSHIRSLLAMHLMDVASTDQHTVKPWFDGKLDFAPPVRDFTADGFPLMGGRLDYVDGHTVAAVVYGKKKHYINLFIWPSEGPPQAPRMTTRNGYNLVNWTASGMTFWAVSDVNQSDLQALATLVSGDATPSPSKTP